MAAQFCAECGSPLRPGVRFCSTCGATVETAAPAGSYEAAPGPGAPPAYNPAGGYGVPPGQGAPGGYGTPGGYGAPSGYGPPAGYGMPGEAGGVAYGYPGMAVQTQYAGFWIRFLALFIDGIILGIVNAVFNLALGPGVGSLIGLAISAAYYIYSFTQWNGQTIGARAASIKVVDGQGRLLTTNAAAIRWAVANASGFVFALGWLAESPALLGIGSLVALLQLIGYLMMLWSPQKQTFHDKMAGSYVIKV